MAEHVPQHLFERVLHSWAEKNPKDAAFVTLDIPENAEYWLCEDISAGFGITDDGELVALFNGSGKSGIGTKLTEKAVSLGATHLWCFETLEEFYQRVGFETVEHMEWDEDMAPENWNYEAYGTPDVIKMVNE